MRQMSVLLGHTSETNGSNKDEDDLNERNIKKVKNNGKQVE